MATLESRPSSAGRRRRWSTRPLNGATDHEVRHLDLRNLSIVQSPDLTTEQRTSLAEIAATNATLYRAYLLKEQLREVFRVKGIERRQLLAGWLSWALHSRIPEFVALARSIRRYCDRIYTTLDHGLPNGRSEATNTHLRALTKRAYGFHSPDALIAMALLTRGGLCRPLPGRVASTQTHENVSGF